MKRARGLVAVLQQGSRRARLLAARDAARFVRTSFIAAALDIGLIDALAHGSLGLDEIHARIGVVVPAQAEFDAFLAVGGELGELRITRGGTRVGLRGIRARALARASIAGDAHGLDALYRSVFAYQLDTYRGLGARLRDGEGRTDLSDHAGLIAKVSLAAEPAAGAALDAIVARSRPSSLLEIGCGEGGYLRRIASAAPALTGLAVELDPSVARAARENLRTWTLDDRFAVEVADIRDRVASLRDEGRRFDLVTLTNNIYYFEPGDRLTLMTDLRALLTGSGTLVITTMLARGSVAAAHLDLMLRAQAEPAGLPTADALRADLERAGYGRVELMRLLPGEPYVCLAARR